MHLFRSMLWNKVPVTVRRLHKKPADGGNVDMLITESEYMGYSRLNTCMLNEHLMC